LRAAKHSVAEAFAARKFFPCGVVIASPSDTAWTAAVALAAGHGEPIGWVDEPYFQPDQVLGANEADRLLQRVVTEISGKGYPGAALGDAIETITICRDMAGRVTVTTPAGKQAMLAMTDLFGRGADGKRWAFAGWVFGDETRAAYIAMCSLFLPRSKVWLYHTYPDNFDRGAYGPADAEPILAARGYEVRVTGDSPTVRGWLNLLPGGVTTDVFAMNTKGNFDAFDMGNNGSCHAVDVPVLNTPVALHLVHSWSGWEPENPGTVGGRWLQHGAYAYVGSVDEPTLGAFQPMKALAERWANYTPFLVAARHWDATPWKVNTIGDPLMLVRPPNDPPAPPRVLRAAEYGVDLGEQVKVWMRQAKDDATGKTFGDAVRALNLLGRDEIAIQLWRAALESKSPFLAARPALGPLFRSKDGAALVQAWTELPERDAIAVDMLWHAFTPRLSASLDEDTLLALSSNIRRPADVDLARIAGQLASRLGEAHLRGVAQREMDEADGPEARQRIAEIMEKH
jgi:hypothetical protein